MPFLLEKPSGILPPAPRPFLECFPTCCPVLQLPSLLCSSNRASKGHFPVWNSDSLMYCWDLLSCTQ